VRKTFRKKLLNQKVKIAAETEGLNYSRLLEAAIKETLGIAS